MQRLITPVILSGGSGTRLWPLSRTSRPKQLLSLTHAETMLQLTARRMPADAGFAAPLVVANAAHASMIESQLAEIGIEDASIILEPVGRNTAPAIAAAALMLPREALMLVMPSDHVIRDVESFRAAVTAAMPLAEEGWLTTFGITPDAPETGYGYIKRGGELAPGVFRVDRFIEKPDQATAQAYLDEGGYSWNGGIFLFGAGAYLDALAQYEPQMLAAVTKSIEGGKREGNCFYPDPHDFAASPGQAVDYAVMEKADKVMVVPVEMGWSDVGSWDALHTISLGDDDGNVHHGEVVAIDTKDCMIRSEGPLVAAVGVKDLIVIATPDAVLILPRGSSQEVKRAVAALQEKGHITLDRAL
ncbi:mannose-1-phosphate guanylyltransferase/mannose-6-phosphate isomerase [Sphingomonas sp. MMS24-J13]|uniref:mannose-1-phosphate guanylyltransferase/mannose-6-phosphate isomerase n=1 Tax=Sphingomonas sp. MMS24-J13 TaxID=3238686 RepID=UPI00384F8D91